MEIENIMDALEQGLVEEGYQLETVSFYENNTYARRTYLVLKPRVTAGNFHNHLNMFKYVLDNVVEGYDVYAETDIAANGLVSVSVSQISH